VTSKVRAYRTANVLFIENRRKIGPKEEDGLKPPRDMIADTNRHEGDGGGSEEKRGWGVGSEANRV